MYCPITFLLNFASNHILSQYISWNRYNYIMPCSLHTLDYLLCDIRWKYCRVPRKQSSWGQHGAHLGPVGPRWTPCWPHEPRYQGSCQFPGLNIAVIAAKRQLVITPCFAAIYISVTKYSVFTITQLLIYFYCATNMTNCYIWINKYLTHNLVILNFAIHWTYSKCRPILQREKSNELISEKVIFTDII